MSAEIKAGGTKQNEFLIYFLFVACCNYSGAENSIKSTGSNDQVIRTLANRKEEQVPGRNIESYFNVNQETLCL